MRHHYQLRIPSTETMGFWCSLLGHTCTSLTCGYLSPGMDQASIAAGHSYGGSSPSRHMLTYMLTAHARDWTCPALHLIDSYGLISTCQEHDIPARIPASASVGADHEPDNALTRHSYQSMSSSRINLSPGRPVVARMPGRRRSRAIAESSVRERPPAPVGYRSAPFGAALSTTAQSRATSVAAGGGSVSFEIGALRLSSGRPARSSSWALDRPGRRSACTP